MEFFSFFLFLKSLSPKYDAMGFNEPDMGLEGEMLLIGFVFPPFSPPYECKQSGAETVCFQCLHIGALMCFGDL